MADFQKLVASTEEYGRAFRMDVVSYIYGVYDLILSASRTPRVGDRVQQVELQDSPNEKLIVYYPQGIEELVDRNDKFTVLAQSETALLLDTTSSPMPYFEHFTVFSLSKRVKAQQMRVYSYTDAESFIQALPQVAVLGGVLLFAAILWTERKLLKKLRSRREIDN